jgi:hypothetical protein
MARRLGRSLACLTLLVTAAAACGGDDEGATTTTTTEAATTTTTEGPSTTTSTAPPATATTAAPPTTTTTAPAPPVLRPGASGPAVQQLQRRLHELRYWVGPADGTYGTLTEQAVYAFQKVNGLAVDGAVGPQVRAALADPAAPTPQSGSGTVWEVDKGRQVLMLVRDGAVAWTWNTSTGTERPYTHEGRRLLADTPPGRFEITREVDGWRDGALGRLWRPKYFHPDGIAIHGYGSVPPVPASHGCVRVTIAAMNAIWDEGLAPLGTAVWVYGTTPA